MTEKTTFDMGKQTPITSNNTSRDMEMTLPENEKGLKESYKDPVTVKEICELRTENRKVFCMSDGSEQAVFYPYGVHVFDRDTQTFEEIDNDLVDEKDGKYVRNGKNRFSARFNKDANDDEIFSVEQGKYGVRVSLMKQHRKNCKQKVYKHDCCHNQICFCDKHGNAEMKYSVCNSGVKEDIIVNTKAAEYRYPFVMECQNLVAVLSEDGKRVSFCDSDNNTEIFHTPAPFMTDVNGEQSTAVSYELLTQEDGTLLFTVVADSEWMNTGDRAFPVVIDPQVVLSGSTNMEAYGWYALTGYSGSAATSLVTVGVPSNAPFRMAMNLDMPVLPNNVRIKKAELTVQQNSGSYTCDNAPLLGVYEMTTAPDTTTTACAHSNYPLDYAVVCPSSSEDETPVRYTFDITKSVDKFFNGESEQVSVLLRFVEESQDSKGSVTLCSTGFDATGVPKLTITYESGFGNDFSYTTHTHEIGAFGQARVDLQTRNLMMDLTDFSWSGNRMPVTIKHAFNSAAASHRYSGIRQDGTGSTVFPYLADFNAMNVGYGWRLNLMQSIRPFSFVHEGATYNGYAYADENGELTYFKKADSYYHVFGDETDYELYVDVDDDNTSYVPALCKMWIGNETRIFDSTGRLIQIIDAYDNKMTIAYTDGRITSVTDGADRAFAFAYNGNYLIRITAPDNKALVEYTYDDGYLTEICYPENKSVCITYVSLGYQIETIVVRQNDTSVSGFQYNYSTADSDRLSSVYEFTQKDGVRVLGNHSGFAYSAAANRAIVTTYETADAEVSDSEDITIKTVYCFDDNGNVISTYAYTADTGNTGLNGEAGSGVHPYLTESGMGIIPQSTNLLLNHSFETEQAAWVNMSDNLDDTAIEYKESNAYSKYGSHYLRINSQNAEAVANGVYQEVAITGGEYTFSAYVSVRKTFSASPSTAGVYLRVTTMDGTILAESEHLTTYFLEYVRLVLPFKSDETQSVKVCILLDGNGTVHADGAQLEDNPFANDYNLLTNSNFEQGLTDWNHDETTGTTFATDQFNGARALRIAGDLHNTRSAYQSVAVKTGRGDREVFTLSGWAKASSLPLGDRGNGKEPTFCLRAKIKYYDTYYKEYGEEKDIVASFCPCTEEWQFASVQFEKSKFSIVQDIKIYCEYNYNTGVALFDDIQLIRNSYESGLSAGDFAFESIDDYGDDIEVMPTEQDTETDFEEYKDNYGNALTETTFSDGEFGTLYRAFVYGNNANDLICETDARGGETTYTVEPATSRNMAVVNRLGDKTVYAYDEAGRTANVASFAAQRNEDGTAVVDENNEPQYEEAPMAQVSYAYNAFDAMAEIARGDGLKYVLSYNTYNNLESIGVDGKSYSLVKYSYKNSSGRLKQVTYANGDTMKATYNTAGQMIAEKWYDKTGMATEKYKYTYNGQGNIVRSVDFKALKEYTYSYEDGKLVRAAEYDITVNSDEMITSRTLKASILYTYSSEGVLSCKRVIPVGGAQQIVYYDAENNNMIVKFRVRRDMESPLENQVTIMSHCKTDSFGRKEFDELQLGAGFVSRRFRYHDGEVTQNHIDAKKMKSGPTTHLVREILYADGRTIAYEYDAEERITKVTDSVEGVTEYTYDALGQLLKETHKADKNSAEVTVVNVMEYDHYGNITRKNDLTYTYSDTWKDLLTAIGTQVISYDYQGNPLNYNGRALTWEKGRQLRSFGSNIQFTYNANGIRTSKTVNGVKHEYLLEGNKILREAWTDASGKAHVLVPLYDNEGSVCGIEYNTEPFFFVKNLQGDSIAITDNTGKVVVRYTYDAWGVCETAFVDETVTNAAVIAGINPFRYRGYYFDTETGLYYLQSRYYDPEVGRFINADYIEFAVTDGIAMKSNLFAYCLNNGVNHSDDTGTDAVWLQAKLSVLSFGHTGLLFKYSGKWWYWYWGADFPIAILGYLPMLRTYIQSNYSINTITFIAFLNAPVCACAKLKEISSNITPKNYKEEALKKANKLYDSIDGTKFDACFYIKGKFSPAYRYFKQLQGTKYRLLDKNCMQTTVDGLRKGTFTVSNSKNKKRLLAARSMVIPNLAYRYLEPFF